LPAGGRHSPCFPLKIGRVTAQHFFLRFGGATIPVWSLSIFPAVGSTLRSTLASSLHSFERISALAQCR
jgi:hypothetical protein